MKLKAPATALLAALIFPSLALAEVKVNRARITGPPEMVFQWNRPPPEGHCDRASDEPGIDVPDIPARAFRDNRGRVQLIASTIVTRRMIGTSLNNVRHECAVILDSNKNPDPSQYDDMEWLHSVYTPDGATVYGLVHNEFQGHTHPTCGTFAPCCPSGVYETCWYNSVALVTSNNSGDSYAHTTAPTHRVASVPYRYQPDNDYRSQDGPYKPHGQPVGIFNSGNILSGQPGLENGYYYVFFNGGTAVGDQEEGIGVMRTNNLSDPASWRAWDGSGFNVRFMNPYTEIDDPRRHIFKPLDLNLWMTSVTFNAYLNQYLMMGTGTLNGIAGIYYSTSNNLTSGWSQPELLRSAQLIETFQNNQGLADPIMYPSALDPASPSRNFETTGKTFYVYYSAFNWNRSGKGSNDIDLMRVKVTLE